MLLGRKEDGFARVGAAGASSLRPHWVASACSGTACESAGGTPGSTGAHVRPCGGRRKRGRTRRQDRVAPAPPRRGEAGEEGCTRPGRGGQAAAADTCTAARRPLASAGGHVPPNTPGWSARVRACARASWLASPSLLLYDLSSWAPFLRPHKQRQRVPPPARSGCRRGRAARQAGPSAGTLPHPPHRQPRTPPAPGNTSPVAGPAGRAAGAFRRGARDYGPGAQHTPNTLGAT